jgi:hypothetical protein
MPGITSSIGASRFEAAICHKTFERSNLAVEKKYLANIYCPSLIFASMAKGSQGLYSQHFIFFLIYKWPDKLERLYLVSFPAWCNVTLQSIVSYEENEGL